MTKTKLFVGTLVAIFTLSASANIAFAAQKKKSSINNEVQETSVTHQESRHDSSPSNTRIGVGLTSINVGGGSGALSTWIDLGTSGLSIQGLFAIQQTSPFGFGIGGILRKTVVGNQDKGLHVGGGLQLGTVGSSAAAAGQAAADALNKALGGNVAGSGSGSAFYINISPVAGFHYMIPGTNNIGLSFDAGLNFQIVDGNFQFSTAPLSGLVGLSIHYYL